MYLSQGVYINSYCGNNYHMVSWQYEHLLQRRTINSSSSSSSTTTSGGHGYEERSAGDIYRSSDCAISTLLVFQQPKSEVIMCMLLRYDDENFLSCIEEDAKFGGATCIKEAFDECFDKLNVIYRLDYIPPLYVLTVSAMPYHLPLEGDLSVTYLMLHVS